jgi:hypothetical protein
MRRIRNFLPVAVAALLGGAVILGAPAQARANLQIRFTEVDSTNHVIATTTSSVQANGNNSFQSFNTSLGDFSITAANNITTTGGFVTAHSETINLTYNGATLGSSGPKLLVEYIGDGYVAPPSSTAFITNNSSPSSSGLTVNSVSQSSSVISGNQVGSGIAAAPAVGSVYTSYFAAGVLLGTTVSTGAVGSGTSGVLTPNPGIGPNFALTTPFTFYQIYGFSNFGTTNQAGSLSAGSNVSSVPAPAALVLALTGLPVLGVSGWLRRRRALRTA